MENSKFQLQAGDKILRLSGVIELTGLSRSTIYSYMGEGKFPMPVSLGQRSVGWLYSSIAEWIEERVAKSQYE